MIKVITLAATVAALSMPVHAGAQGKFAGKYDLKTLRPPPTTADPAAFK